jgi:superfamily II DNA or RNA helicase
LIAGGFLCPPRYYCPPSGVSLEGVHTVAGDFNKAEVEVLMDKPRITGSAVAHYTRICPGAPAVAFCTSIKHAEHVAATFREAGYRSETIDGEMDEHTRIEKVRGLGNGRIHVLTSVDLISEGFDLPIISAAILLRPTQSLALHIQQCGRPMRISPNKKNCWIIDHVGNVLRHGLIEVDREWTLEPTAERRKKKKVSSVAIRQCSKCYAVFAPLPICPQCGHVMEIQSRMVDEVEGQLVELNPTEIAARKEKLDEREKQQREHLKNIARARGYKPQWVEHILSARRAKQATA